MPKYFFIGQGRQPSTRIAGVFALTAGLVACGGGGSSGGDGSTGSSNPSLSQAQQGFESVYLQSNGGGHSLRGQLVTQGQPGGGYQLTTGSFFYSVDDSLVQSPAAGPQPWIATRTTVAKTLTVPANLSPARYMVEGSVVAQASPGVARISYVDGAVQQDWLSSDGEQVTHSEIGTDFTLVPLAGAISQSPAELFSGSDLGLLTNSVNGSSFYDKSASWQSGSRYLKVTQITKGDQLLMEDCLAPATSGTEVTPCRTGITELSQFFPVTFSHTGSATTYQFSDGTVTSVAGITAWVATQPDAGSPSVAYRVLYLSSGSVYTGVLLRDGTQMRVFPLGSQTPQDFSIVFNSAAIASVSASLAF